MKTFTKKTLLAGLALAAVVGIAVAQNYGPGMMGGYGPGAVNLTPEQQTKMLEIQKKLDQQRWDLMGKMHQQGYQGMHAYKDGKFDEAGARKQFEVMTGFHKQMFEIMIQGQKEVDALLTPDQRKQLQQPWGRR